MPSRLLVTGGGGFVANHVLRLAAGTWTGDILATRFGEAGLKGVDVDSVRLDIRDRAAVLETVDAFQPTEILHLAAISAPAQAQQDPADAWRANVLGAMHIAEAAASGRTHQLVLASTAEVYGRAFLTHPIIEETADPRPTGVYGRSKLAAEQAVTDILSPSSCAGVIVRAANHSGPGQDERFVMPAFAAQVARIEAGLAPPTVATGDLTARRDFLDVRDVARAYLSILETPPISGVSVLNLGSGFPRPVGEIMEILAANSRRSFDVVQDPARLRPQEIPSAGLNASYMRALYGWRPEISFETMVRDVLTDFRERVG